ncbi:MAG: zinc ribbon domain-containing protein [Pseudomonadota bacterium]
MPLYEYECQEHGVFEATRPMAQFDQPCPCPVCGELSPRATSLPRVAALSEHARRAHATNERARHEPRSSRDSDPRNLPNGSTGRGRRALQRADGSKSNPASRPWMLSY